MRTDRVIGPNVLRNCGMFTQGEGFKKPLKNSSRHSMEDGITEKETTGTHNQELSKNYPILNTT